MLAQLLSAHQVTLLCNSSMTYLFFRGKVYVRPTQFGFYNLPSYPGYCPIWALIDMDYQKTAPPIERDTDIWPIQASSPQPSRWKTWIKQYGASLLAMPLWSMEELEEGYVFSSFSLPSTTNPSHVVQWRPH